MKTLYRCIECYHYSLKKDLCKKCGGKVIHPYPARFSMIKERRFRKLLKKQ